MAHPARPLLPPGCLPGVLSTPRSSSFTFVIDRGEKLVNELAPSSGIQAMLYRQKCFRLLSPFLSGRGYFLGLAASGLALSLLTSGPAAASADDTAYTITTLAGSDAVGDSGKAAGAQIAQAEGLATDPQGNLYIADAAGHRVRRVTPAGIITTIAGTGSGGFSGDGGPATAAQLNSPYGLAVDASGALYIADLGNGRVRRVRADGVIETVAGGGNAAPDGTTAAGPTQAKFNAPRNVAVDWDSTLYISDFAANRVYRVSPAGAISIYAGGGQGTAADGAQATSMALSSPAGLAIDAAGRLYLADSGSKRILRIDHGVVSDMRVPGLITPTGVDVDISGTVYVADQLRGSTARVNSGGTITELKAAGRDVAVISGVVYLSDGRVVRSVTTLGAVNVFAGSGSFGFSGDGGPAASARMLLPSALAADSSGNYYIADAGNHRIRRVDAGGMITTVAGTGEAGYSGDSALATGARLASPAGIAVDKTGLIYIADTGNHRIRRIGVDGFITTVAGTGTPAYGGDNTLASRASFSSPNGLAVDSAGNVYIADTGNHRIRKLFGAGVVITVAGTGASGYSGDGGAATAARLNSPTAVAVDASGRIYIADSGNNTVRRVEADGTITTLAPSATSWNSPQGVAVTSTGEVFIADTGNNTVLRWTPADGTVSVAAGSSAGFGGDGGPGRQALLNAPRGLFVDSSGAILVADSANGRIRKLVPGSANATNPTTPPADVTTPQAQANLVSAASFLGGGVAPGELVSLLGSGFGPAKALASSVAWGGAPEKILGEIQVTFDGIAAPLFYVSDTQINAQVPYAVGGRTSAKVTVLFQGTARWTSTVEIVEAAPAVLTAGAGTGQAVALNQDGTLNSSSSGAPRGTVVTFYVTGAGQTTPTSVDGTPASGTLGTPLLPVRVIVGDNPADVLWAGSAPGLIGLTQVTIRTPGQYTPTGSLNLRVLVGNHPSQDGVTLAVR
jgi:uncharacterized protein (TIGR03437 family)